mgnify:CR=1 FL=1
MEIWLVSPHGRRGSVTGTTAVWNLTPVDAANRAAWMAARQAAGYPVLVATGAEGAVLGYASFGDWRAFDGYRFTVEHSVYVRADVRGGGIGALTVLTMSATYHGLTKDEVVHASAAGRIATQLGSALGVSVCTVLMTLTHGVGWSTFAYFTVFTTLMAATATRLPRGTVVRK